MKRHPPWKCPKAIQLKIAARAVIDNAASMPRGPGKYSGMSSANPAKASAAPPQPMVQSGTGRLSDGTISHPSAMARGGSAVAKKAAPMVLMVAREVLMTGHSFERYASGCDASPLMTREQFDAGPDGRAHDPFDTQAVVRFICARSGPGIGSGRFVRTALKLA